MCETLHGLITIKSSGYIIPTSIVDGVVLSYPVPTITAEVVLPGDPPAAGQSYSLMCTVTGADSLNSTINYQWFKTTPSRTQVGTNSLTLTFDPLDLSDAGQYECIVSASSPFLVGPLTDTSDTVNLNIQSKK